MQMARNHRRAITLLACFCVVGAAQVPPSRPRFPPGIVEGNVVDAANDSPLANVLLKICKRINSSDCTSITADAKGQFSATVSHYDSEYEATTTLAGYAVQSVTLRSRPIDGPVYVRRPGPDTRKQPRIVAKTIRLTAFATVTGIVKDADGNPAPKAHVIFRPDGGEARPNRTVADANGYFTVDVYPGPYAICAVPVYEAERGFRPQQTARDLIPASTCQQASASFGPQPAFVLKAAERVGPLTFSLGEAKSYSIRGSIEALVRETPPWRTSVWAVPGLASVHGGQHSLPGFSDQRTKEFWIHGLRAGTYTVVAMAGVSAQSDTSPIPPRFLSWKKVEVGPATPEVHLILRSSLALRATVVVDGYQAQSAPSVLLRPELPEDFLLVFSGRIGVEGNVLISDVPEGDYAVHASTGAEGEYIASIRFGGKEVSGQKLRLRHDGPTELEIRLRRWTGSVRLQFARDRFGSTPSCGVAIPEGAWDRPGQWIVRPLTGESAYEREMSNLPPGHYVIFATGYCSGLGIGYWKAKLMNNVYRAAYVEVKDGPAGTIAVRSLDLYERSFGPMQR